MMGIFIGIFVIPALTALIILTSGALGSGESGTTLAQMTFRAAFGGLGDAFIALWMLFFAFSTIIGWYFIGEVNVRALFGEKAVRAYSLIVVVFVLAGSLLKVDLVRNLSDLFNGLMAVPTLLVLLALSGVVAKAAREP